MCERALTCPPGLEGRLAEHNNTGLPPRRQQPAPPSEAELRRAREIAAGDPPRSEQYADESRFHAKRAAWYKAFTGVPLPGTDEGQPDLAKQWEAFPKK